jgi:ethanolamine ammonia-lyase small subunit
MPEQEDKPTHGANSLKQYTAARIGIGHTGVSIPVEQSLQFKLAHAHARDAVHSKLDVEKVAEELQASNFPVLAAHSRAETRYQYLQRPDLGRLLDDQSKQTLMDHSGDYDICFIIADGLSATAVNHHAATFLAEMNALLKGSAFKIAPVILATQARVAIADEIAFCLQARLSIIIIGERPGLSAADSLGVYLTFQPRPGLTDDSRNCISNIRPGGLDFKTAAQKLHYLIQEAFRLQLSGVNLKDDAGLLR